MFQAHFGTLLVGELDRLYAFASCLLSPQADLDAVVYETYRRAMGQSIPSNPARHTPRLWLLKHLYGVVVLGAAGADVGARDSSSAVDPSCRPLAVPAGECPICYDLSALDWDRADDSLCRAIGLLPVAYRMVMLLWAVERCNYGQIADLLDIPVAVVMSRLFKARMVVSTQLGELATEWALEPAADRTVSGVGAC